MLGVNLLIGWQYDLVFVLPLLLVGLAVAVLRHRPLRTPMPDFTTPYDWATQGI